MFSYLRPHRRAPSASTSPVPEQAPSWEGPIHAPSEHAHPRRFQHGNHSNLNLPAKTSPVPSLPPLVRVSSVPEQWEGDLDSDTYAHNKDNSRVARGTTNLGTLSEPLRMLNTENERPKSAGKSGALQNTIADIQQTSPQQDLTSRERAPPRSWQSSVTLESQSKPLMTGRRPTGARLTTPPSGSKAVSGFEPAQPRTGKRLNLLNPMSLLARRRTSNSVAQLSAESLKSSRSGNKFNESFDPRIKGTVVHDFSAPRPRRIVSTPNVRPEENSNPFSRQYKRNSNNSPAEAAIDESPSGPWSGGSHTPVFTEDFDEAQYPAAGPHVRKASDFSDLILPSLPYAGGAQKPAVSNSILTGNNDEQKDENVGPGPQELIVDSIPPIPPKSEGRKSAGPSRRVSIDPVSTPLKPTISSKKSRPRNVSQGSLKDAAGFSLPKHMKSTSSRFSFDMIGAAEQERLLEDRHRQRALEKEKEGVDAEEEDDDDAMYEEDYDYDNMDDDDLEERIPGVNADYEEDNTDDYLEEPVPGVNSDALDNSEKILDDHENIAGLSFQHPLISPLSPYSLPNTPRDANGEVIGFAMTKNSPHPSMDTSQTFESALNIYSPSGNSLDHVTEAEGLGIQKIPIVSHSEVEQYLESDTSKTSGIDAVQKISGLDDDDLYFDDGQFGDLGEEGFEFDESVFDNVDTDQYGRPLKALSSVPTLYSPPMLTTDPSPSFSKIPEELNAAKVLDESIDTSILLGSLAPKPSVINNNARISAVGTAPGLTHDKLAAYQSALAEAAFNAAAKGKFRRDSIQSRQTTSDQGEPYFGLLTDSSHVSHQEPFSPSYDFEEEDGFDYDDVLDEDDIIAAANAEALAYDTDGFYGQEFGFYSAPAAGEAEYVNGGYFGPRGAEGVMRSQSNRVASREPNLTPITERSEYSNRNSFMFGMHRPESLTSPGLSQLINSPDYEGDMSLNALLKLRRGAWGGSQASLHSSNGSPAGPGDESSPIQGQLPPWAYGGAVTLPYGGHVRASSASSILTGIQSSTNSAPTSPTLTMAGFAPLPARDGSKSTSTSPDKEKTEKESEFRRHRSTTSSDSISYSKEEDPGSPTGERWILERRRTSELGEVELLGREVVTGPI